MINFRFYDAAGLLDRLRQHYGLAMQQVVAGKGDAALPDNYRNSALKDFQNLHKLCGEWLLRATEDRMVRLWGIWSEYLTFGGLGMELKPLLETFEDDLRKIYFYRYPKQKVDPLLMINHDWRRALKAFPSIIGEIEAGLDCYALEHNEACIFHMMRIAEIGMRSLARERQVAFPNHPLEWAEWDNVIDQIESKAKAATAGMKRGPERDAARSFYTGAAAHLRAFKETRNRVMHTRGPAFDPLDAQKAINQVRDFMNALSEKIGEKTKKPIQRWP